MEITITFNCRLKYKQSLDCIEKIKNLGGDGNIMAGGSWYSGTKEQIDNLITYMLGKDYDLASMSVNNN